MRVKTYLKLNLEATESTILRLVISWDIRRGILHFDIHIVLSEIVSVGVDCTDAKLDKLRKSTMKEVGEIKSDRTLKVINANTESLCGEFGRYRMRQSS